MNVSAAAFTWGRLSRMLPLLSITKPKLTGTSSCLKTESFCSILSSNTRKLSCFNPGTNMLLSLSTEACKTTRLTWDWILYCPGWVSCETLGAAGWVEGETCGCDCCASAPVARHTPIPARKNVMRKAARRPRLLVGSVVAGLRKYVKGREPFGWFELDLDLSPNAVALRVARFVSQNILVTELHPDFCGDIGQFAEIANGKNSSSGHLCHFRKQRRAIELFVCSRTNPNRVINTDRIQLAVGFFQEVLYVVLVVPAMIITPVGYDEQGPFGVVCTPHLAEPQIDRVEQGRAPARGRKHHSCLQFFHAIGEAAGQLGAIVETYQKELIEWIRRSHELHGGLTRLVDLVGHAAAHVKNQ